MKTLPGRDRLASSRSRGASVAPLRCLEITEDPPRKALQEVGLAASPHDENPEKTNLCYIGREKISDVRRRARAVVGAGVAAGRLRPALTVNFLRGYGKPYTSSTLPGWPLMRP